MTFMYTSKYILYGLRLVCVCVCVWGGGGGGVVIRDSRVPGPFIPILFIYYVTSSFCNGITNQLETLRIKEIYTSPNFKAYPRYFIQVYCIQLLSSTRPRAGAEKYRWVHCHWEFVLNSASLNAWEPHFCTECNDAIDK